MKLDDLKKIKTKRAARQFAIDWQNWQCREGLSYLVLTLWAIHFRKLGKRFGLLRKFKENGIV